jgi:hypothetical protein
MTDASARADHFKSLNELQQVHLELMKQLNPSLGSVSEGYGQEKIRDFVSRAKNTGVCLEDASERRAAQNILDYWSAEAVSIGDVSEKNWTPEKLVPYNPGQPEPKQEPDAETIAALQRARKKIQLAAAARLWKDSGRASGYLLNGRALKEAEDLAGGDPEIGDLVIASKLRVQAERRNIWLALAFVVLCAIIAWLLLDRAAEQRQLAALEAERSVAVAKQVAEKTAAEVRSQQADIKTLTEELKSAKLPVSSEISETVPDTVLAEQKKSHPSSSAPTSLHGYIWIGSDNSPNLLDANTDSPVKPSEVIPGASYKVSKNLVLRTTLPTADYLQGDSAGIVPEQTTIKLLSPPVSYRRPAPAASKPGPGPSPSPSPTPSTILQYWAQVDVPNSDQPIAYLEYAAPTGVAAQALAQKLKTKNFRIPGVEASDLAKGLAEIRYFFPTDNGAAGLLSEAVNGSIKELQISGIPTVKVIDGTAQRGPRNYPGVLELWLDLSAAK